MPGAGHPFGYLSQEQIEELGDEDANCAGDRMASSRPRGALKRAAGIKNLLQTGSSSAFLTHFLVSADDFKILLVKCVLSPQADAATAP
jgi:hypothetical protein